MSNEETIGNPGVAASDSELDGHASTDPEIQRRIRERVTQLAFGGDALPVAPAPVVERFREIASQAAAVYD